jgi:cell division protein FtsQ
MARRATNAELPAPPPKKSKSIWRTLRTAVGVATALCALVGCLWAAVKVEQYVVADREFVLQGPPEPGIASEHFQITGLVHAPEQRIVDVFARDFGRSVYLCPIEERRRRLLAVDWVRDAAVSRVWPNRIVVHLTERVPVAFVQTPGIDGTRFYSLADADGVLLDPQHAGQLALPVISGFPVQASEAVRGERMKRFLRLQAEFGSEMDNISEVDIADGENLKLTQEFEGRALTLMVGNQKFLQRYKNFTDNYVEIRKRLPDATTFDLRLTDRITAVDPPESGAKSAPAEERRK